MEFGYVLKHVISRLDSAGIRFALIGGFAMAEKPLDWELLCDYLEIFEQQNKLEELQGWYGAADRNR